MLSDELPSVKEKPQITYTLIDEEKSVSLTPKKSFWSFFKRTFG